MDIDIDLTTLVLSAVYVAEVDGNPMTASDLAFMLELPQGDIDMSLFQLVESGSISMDGERYRYDLNRRLTASEAARLDDLHNGIERLRPLLDKIEVRFNS
ncbi:MAG: hypothetical protein ABW006_06510 [Hyphomicrobium sp.]